jgi:transcriptional regulator with XRE-family HTH domain
MRRVWTSDVKEKSLSTRTDFATRLETAMQKAGFRSQSALSRTAGVPQPTINRLLKAPGAQGPESTTVRKLAQACGVSSDWLLNGTSGGDVLPVQLTERQAKWLLLLDSLGSDDIVEFTALIVARQARNRRLLNELAPEQKRVAK